MERKVELLFDCDPEELSACKALVRIPFLIAEKLGETSHRRFRSEMVNLNGLKFHPVVAPLSSSITER